MDLTTEALHLGMSMARTRAEVASANIANVDTQGYRSQRADFGQAVGLLHEAALRPDMGTDRLHALSSSGFSLTSVSPNGEDASVHLDGEVAELEGASVDYQTMTTVLSRRFALMQLAMAGRN